MAEYTLEPIEKQPSAAGYTLEPINGPVVDTTSNVLSFRQGKPETMWDKMSNLFPGDVKVQSAKATNSLVYSEMFGISPDQAYTYHDEISKQVQDLLSTEKVVTNTRGIGGSLSSGLESSFFGMMVKQKVPTPFESVSQLERWIQGMTAMGLDLPFFMAGYGLGGGTPIIGMAGAFGFTAGMRQMLVDRYSKGEVKSIGELTQRIKEAATKTVQGQIIGAATGYAGSLSKLTSLKLASELATMTTAGRLVEGQLPTVQDFIDNAGMLLVMHYGLRGYESVKSRLPEIRAKLQDSFIDSGAHPKTIAETIAIKTGVGQKNYIDDLTYVLDRVNTEIKANAPAEPVEKPLAKDAKAAEDPSAEIVQPGDSQGGKQPVNVWHGSKNAMVEGFDPSLEGSGIVSQGQKYGGTFFTTSKENAGFFADYKDLPKKISVDDLNVYGDGKGGYYYVVDQEGTAIINHGPFKTETAAEKAGGEAVTRYNDKMARGEDMFVTSWELKPANPMEATGADVTAAGSMTNLAKQAKAAGHDALIVRDYVDGSHISDIYVVFDKNIISQPKSPSPLPEAGAKSKEPTSIKNAVVDAEREAMGLPPIGTPVTERPSNWRETVEAKVDSGEIDPRAIANKINNLVDIGEKPSILNDEGNHALLYDKKKLQNEHKAVEDAITEAEKTGQDTTELQNRRDEIETAIDANHKATKATGTEQGRALQSRQDAMNEDYSFSAMIQRAKVDGVPITPEVRDIFKKLSKKIEQAEGKIGKVDEEVIKDSVEKTIKIIKTEEAKKQRETKRIIVKEQLDSELDLLVAKFNKQIGGQLNIGLDPTAIATLIDMARNRINKGIVTAEGIVDDIHTAIKKTGIEFSKRDIQDAISGYGITKKMSQEDIDIKLREAKNQMRLLSSLEDALKGVAPEKTGLQRDPQSDRVRELTRQVNEAMRESGIQRAVSPEQQWKTSLDAAKTRLKNQISDLSREILTREKAAKTKGVEYDEEANILKSYRDQLKNIHDQVFEKPNEGMTPEKQAAQLQKEINRELQTLDKSISEYIRKTAEKDVATKKKGENPPKTEDIALMRDAKEQAKTAFEEMKKELNPPQSPEDRARQAFRTRKTNEISEYERRLKEGDFAPKTKKEPTTLTDKELKVQFELDQIKREYAKAHVEFQLANRTGIQKITGGVVESMRIVRALKSAFDVSAVGRQGWLAFVAHPITGMKNIPGMFRALGSDEAMFRIDKAILERPNAALYKKAELSFTETGSTTLSKMEEQFQSRWAESIPGVNASNRAYSTYLNLIRADLFDAVHSSAKFEGGKATDAELKAIGNYVNESTGRGNIKGYESALTGLGVFLWAPKLVLSRFQMLMGHSMWGGSAATRVAIAKEYGRILRGIGIIYAISSLWDDVTIEDSPISTDFGKVKIGNRRIDVLAGLTQSTVMMSRVLTGEIKKASGAIIPLTDNVPYGGTTVAGVLGNFLRTKLSPVIGTAIDLRQGKDVVGNKVTLWDIPEKALMPLSFGDIYDAMNEDGIPGGAILSTLATFGIGVQIYDPANRNR